MRPMRVAADAQAIAEAGKPLRLQAPDGTPLAATVFDSAGSDWIVVGGATAVPRGVYRRFAEFAQARGVNVLTLDYRGIGGSRPGTLRGYHPAMADWARQDLATAVAYAAARGPVYLVGHSFGGHAIGLLPEPQLLRAAYVVAVGAGWHGWMPWPARIKVLLLWHGIGPLTTAVLGYAPLKRLGVGEDLPASIYRQWKRWCSFPHYYFDDPRSVELARGFDAVTLPIAAANALDDAWAMPASRDAFFKGVRHAPVHRLDIDPAADGLRGIGHMGYFRPQVGAVMWPRMLGWLQQQGLRLNE